MFPFTKTSTVAIITVLLSTAALADEVQRVVGEDTDWLIERRAGQWELVMKGPTGRVHKEYVNQEVLRMERTESGAPFVAVVSMPLVAVDAEIACTERARSEAHDLCSSSFLACRPDPGSAIVGVPLLLFGAGAAATDRRHRLACHSDTEAILQAAKDVGMIRRILPLPEPKR